MWKYYLVLILFTSSVNCRRDRRAGSTYLDIAAEMIDKAKISYFKAENHCSDVVKGPLDCADILRHGHNVSGVYSIWPINRLFPYKPVTVYCDMDTDGGGWTVIQRRGNFLREKEYFFKDWKSYKEGFGSVEKDFWLGNDIIFALTNQKLYSVRFDLENVKLEKRYALYDTFWIDDEYQNYTLHIAGYSGDAGEAMFERHNLKQFSTKDRDNDEKDINCAENFKGGWWYSICHRVNPNGLYLRGKVEPESIGIHWYPWTGFSESLESTEIKIRPLMYKRTDVPLLSCTSI